MWSRQQRAVLKMKETEIFVGELFGLCMHCSLYIHVQNMEFAL